MDAIDEFAQLADSMRQASALLADEDVDENSSSSRRPSTFFNAVALGNTDSQDSNLLIRSLAVRTMGCIRVDKIIEYLCDPLQRCLKVDIYPCFQKFGSVSQTQGVC